MIIPRTENIELFKLKAQIVPLVQLIDTKGTCILRLVSLHFYVKYSDTWEIPANDRQF